MAKLEHKSKENPKLEQAILKDGRISLYLEYYLGRVETPVLDEWGEPVCYTSGKMAGKPKFQVKHIRRKESLDLYLMDKPRTPADRQMNKETLEIAKRIRAEKEQQLNENRNGYRLKKDRAVDFITYFQNYLDTYTKKDKRMVNIALSRFKSFLADTPEYSMFVKGLKPEQLDKDMMLAFADYLQEHSEGEGGKSIFQRFKKVVNYAVEHNVMSKNPCKDVKVTGVAKPKDVLVGAEIVQLLQTDVPNQNPEIRKAFIFSLYTGVRFCDVKVLTFGNVDFASKTIRFQQSKTKGDSDKSWVTIPLRDDLLELIGDGDKQALIFDLPSYEMCCKSVKRWVKRAGIDKNISWHCARHSFATNALVNGADVRVVASILGHSSLTYTMRYLEAVDEYKKKAVDSLPSINK